MGITGINGMADGIGKTMGPGILGNKISGTPTLGGSEPGI
jgi:hypothetical protein